ncbi:MAG: lysophospholipid acyltransferase family protein [Cyclobacteriaceae bacterium]|nr:lysophospholipid acyltransferase family protein [Cyclobacteriaceae bacterium]
MTWKELKRKIKYPMIYGLVKWLIFTTKLFPRTWVLWFYGRLGSLTFSLLKKEQRKTISNIKIAFGNSMSDKEIRSMAREVFIHQAKNGADYVLTLHHKTREKWLKYIDIVGEEHLKKAYDRGKGVICLISHTGSWEFSAITPPILGYETTAVSKALKDKRLNDMIIGFRTSRGLKNLSRGKTYPLLVEALNNGDCLIIMIDQDTKVKSVFIDFLGTPAYTPIGAALLALDTEAAVVPMSMKRTSNNKHQFTIKPEVSISKTDDKQADLLTNTKKFNKVIEEYVIDAGAQWVWMHERWKTTPAVVEELKRKGVIK